MRKADKQALEQLQEYIDSLTEKHMKTTDKYLLARTEQWRESISNSLKNRSLEDIIGKEAAERGRKARSDHNRGRKYHPEVGQKIAATRRANGSYVDNGMTGKKHKESTKEIMMLKAQVRQQLKRELGLGRNDKLDKDLLEQRYILLGLK